MHEAVSGGHKDGEDQKGGESSLKILKKTSWSFWYGTDSGFHHGTAHFRHGFGRMPCTQSIIKTRRWLK
jgi:hypothetical protein